MSDKRFIDPFAKIATNEDRARPKRKPDDVIPDGLEANPWAAFEEKHDPTIPTATLQIYRAVEAALVREESTFINRASSAGMCERRRWYQRKGTKGTPLTPRKILNFAAGDIGEHVVKYFILQGCVGVGKLYSEVDFGERTGTFTVQRKEFPIYEQQTVKTLLGGIEVLGHADGWGKRNSDGQWELIEVKTAADYGFDRFISEGPGDYLHQAHTLMMSDLGEKRGVRAVRFFYMKKSTGHIWDRVFPFDDVIAGEVALGFQRANQEAIPERPYSPVAETYYKKPTGRSVLPWQCGYCPFTETCWSGVQKEFKSGKPVFVIPAMVPNERGMAKTVGDDDEIRKTETA